MLSDEQINQIAAGVEAASGQKSNKNFNYVNITSKGCEGWINLFFGDEIIALIRNVHIANEIKKALSMAEKSNHTSIKEIFGMESAYKEAVSKPFNNMCISTNLVIEMINHIKRLETFEKSRWKYPDKGELPEINKWLDFVVPHWPGRHVGRFVKGIEDDLCFWCELAKTYFSTDKVKAWTYAPVMEEG